MAFLIPENLKSRNDVASGIQRVARAFQVGLDEDVVVWYEPLYDPANERPHLVVLLPALGIVVLEVLEVVRGGSFLGVFRGGIRIVRDGREIEAPNPLIRAQRLADVLRSRIEAEPRLVRTSIPVSAGAVIPSLGRTDAEAKGMARLFPLDQCIFEEDLDAALKVVGEATLLKAFARMLGGTLIAPISGETEKLLRGIIHPDVVIDTMAKEARNLQLTIFNPPDGGEDIIRVMDLQQEAFAKSLGAGHRVIRGVAGSGKTLILVYRARLLAQAFPNQRFLLTCYTRSLAGQLRSLLREYRNVDVMHLDGLMAQVIRAARMRHPGYRDDDDGERVAEVALQALRQIRDLRYHAVLVDEAQDFGTNALKFAISLLEYGREDLVIVADAAQNIFRRKFRWKDVGIQAQGRTRILRNNYRNTREILQFASDFLFSSKVLRPDEAPDLEDENAVIPPESAARSGRRPELFVMPDAQAEVRKVIEIVKASVGRNIPPRSIAILYSSSRDAGLDFAGSLNSGLKSSGIDVFWATDPSRPDAKDHMPQAKAPVILVTIHSAKGLEFPHIILCGIWREGEDAETNRKLAYVGMTRATERLTVVTREGHALVEDLRGAAA